MGPRHEGEDDGKRQGRGPMTATRFSFDTVFDGEGDVVAAAPRLKPYYTGGEVEQLRAQAYADGRAAAQDEHARAEARALEEIRANLAKAMGTLAQAAHGHRAGAAELALAAARKIADAALEQFPTAPAEAALQALLVEISGHPRLLVRAPEAVAEPLQAKLGEAAEQAGFAGQVSVRADPRLQGAAFVFEWGEGRAAFDPAEAAARVQAALTAALAAEGLHAEPLTPSES